MIIKDHVNLQGFAGINPLKGKNEDKWDIFVHFISFIKITLNKSVL